MSGLDDFLLQVQYCTRLDPKQQPQKLLQLLSLRPQFNPYIVKLNNLGSLTESQVSSAVEKRNFYNNEWMAFESVVCSFVQMASQLNPWSVLESFDLYTTFLNDVSVAFTNKTRGYLVTELLVDVVDFVVPMARQLDLQMSQKELHRKPRLSFMASVLLKIFNNIRSQLGADDHIEAIKKAAMLYIGGKLCQTYFRLENPLLCRNVFSNMNNANLRFAAYPMNQQIQYRYYLAKFYLVKNQFVDSYQHFSWCLEHVPTNHMVDSPNVTQILQNLLPIGIVLGKTPSLHKIAQRYYSTPSSTPPFFVLYSSILHAIKMGNFHHLHELLNEPKNASFLKQHKVALIFGTKSFVVTLRNLLKRVWSLQGRGARLDYDALKAGLRVSLNGLDLTSAGTIDAKKQLAAEPDDLVIENCLVTLIDQNLLRGKVFPRLRVVSLAKTEVFPNVDKINFLKYGNGVEGSLNSADKWIG